MSHTNDRSHFNSNGQRWIMDNIYQQDGESGNMKFVVLIRILLLLSKLKKFIYSNTFHNPVGEIKYGFQNQSYFVLFFVLKIHYIIEFQLCICTNDHAQFHWECWLYLWSVCLWVCLSRVLYPTRECFTHLEMSSLQVKGYELLHILITNSHWTVRVL